MSRIQNKTRKLKNAEMNERVEDLYNVLMLKEPCFKDYTSFNEWLTNIPDEELQQLAIKVNSLQAFSRMERSNFEIIISKKLANDISSVVKKKSNLSVNIKSSNFKDKHEWMNYKVQLICEMYSVYVPMLDLYRRSKMINDNDLKKQVAICNRLDNEIAIANSSYYINTKFIIKLKTLFQELRDYKDRYLEVIVKYNRQRKESLFLKKVNINILLIIASFMTMDEIPPPLWA